MVSDAILGYTKKLKDELMHKMTKKGDIDVVNNAKAEMKRKVER